MSRSSPWPLLATSPGESSVARARRAEAGRRNHLFYWSHVGPALIAAVAIPLGFAYGWLVAPWLDAVIPFWAVPLRLGFLSLPRNVRAR